MPDESIDVYLCLKSPYTDESLLAASLQRLVVSLEAQIVNTSAPDRDAPPASEVIFSASSAEASPPTVVSDPEDGASGGDERHTYAIWALPLFLGRPRMRLQGPSAVFTASASYKPPSAGLPDGFRDGYLQSGIASGLNLLDSLGDDPVLGGIKPRLSALRVSRVAPVTQQANDLLRPIQTSPKHLSLPIYPAVHCRIRFARPNTTPPSPAIIAMLEIDFTSFVHCEIALTSINLSVPDGDVEDMALQTGLKLPMSCVAHDHITFLYRVTPGEAERVARNPMRDLSIAIQATALVRPGICTPNLSMAWTTALDFTLPVNPGFGSAMQPIQRSHRPSQLSINSMTSLTAPAVARPDALPLLEAASNKTEASVIELGLTVTFSGPPPTQKIHPGDEFVWNVFVVNRFPPASTAPPRKLALVAIPKRRRNENRVNRPPSVSLGGHGGARLRDRSIAEAVLDETVVHAMQRGSVVEGADVVCLSADVRIGPLAPGACHVADLRFLALKAGIVSLDAIRVIDLGSTEHVDIRDLPIVVVEQDDDGEARGEPPAPAGTPVAAGA